MTRSAKAKISRLTSKERDLLKAFLKTPTSNLLLGAQFGMNLQVTKNYLRAIYKKFGVKSRMELYVFAVQHRILKLNCSECGKELTDSDDRETIPAPQLNSQIFGGHEDEPIATTTNSMN